MGIKFANSAYATLAAGIASGATSITLTTGQGARFPSLGAGDYFYATLIDASNNLEIVKCTARSTDVLTVTRAQEGTTARAYSAGDRIELRVTAAGLSEFLLIANNLSDLANAATARNNLGLAAVAASASASDLTSGSLAIARGGSRLIKTHTYLNNTRQVTSVSSNYNYFTWTLTKVSSTSMLVFHVAMPGMNNTNSGDYIGLGIDGTYDYNGQLHVDAATQGNFVTMVQYRTGISAGARTITLNAIPIDGSANRSIDIINPNNSDDVRNRQQGTVFVVYEIENA